MKKSLIALSILTSTSIAMASSIVKVEYDKPVTLQGNIKKENGYPMLYLSKPISTVLGSDSDGMYNPVDNVNKIQIVWTKEKLPTGCVTVKGELFGAHTAHHQTDVLIDLKSYSKCK